MKRVLVMVLGALLGMAGLPAEEKPLILVSNYPLQWVVETLVGDQAEVVNLTKDAENPREWVPDDAALQLLETADLVVLQGGGYEKWADGDDGKDSFLLSAEKALPAYADRHRFSEEAQALFLLRVQGKTWLIPEYLMYQAREIAAAFKQKKLPYEEAGLQQVEQELGELQRMFADSPYLKRNIFYTVDPELAWLWRQGFHWKLLYPANQEGKYGERLLPTESNQAMARKTIENLRPKTLLLLDEPSPQWSVFYRQTYGTPTAVINSYAKPTAGVKSYPDGMKKNFRNLVKK